jgi:hypothetical protein
MKYIPLEEIFICDWEQRQRLPESLAVDNFVPLLIELFNPPAVKVISVHWGPATRGIAPSKQPVHFRKQ